MLKLPSVNGQNIRESREPHYHESCTDNKMQLNGIVFNDDRFVCSARLWLEPAEGNVAKINRTRPRVCRHMFLLTSIIEHICVELHLVPCLSFVAAMPTSIPVYFGHWRTRVLGPHQFWLSDLSSSCTTCTMFFLKILLRSGCPRNNCKLFGPRRHPIGAPRSSDAAATLPQHSQGNESACDPKCAWRPSPHQFW